MSNCRAHQGRWTRTSVLGRTEMPKRKTRELGSQQQMGMKLLLPDIPQAQCSAGWVPQSGQDWLPEVVEESWVKGVHEKQNSAGE